MTGLLSVLKQLLAHKKLSSNGLAKLLALPTPTIHRLITGEVQDPRISTLLLIANYFEITVDQLLGRKVLDKKFYADVVAKTDQPSCSIPLLTMGEACALPKNIKKATQWFRWHSQISDTDNEKSFSILIKNNLYEPLFSQGSVIVINATNHPENGDYVLVNFEGDSTPVLKRYISEGKNKFFSAIGVDTKNIPLNPKNSKIIGVVIETYRNFKN